MLALAALIFLAPLHAAEVTLAWDPNPEPDIAGYKLYYGTPVGTYSNVLNVGNATETTVVDLESDLTYAFYVTCYNTSGLESEPSNVVEYTVPATGGGNRAPLALSQVATVAPGDSIAIVLQGRDPDGDPLSFNLSSLPAVGQITDYAVNNGTSAVVTYQAPPDYNGQDQFAFAVDDGYETSLEATVTINIQPAGPPAGSTFLIAIEAESASLFAPMSTIPDIDASAGSCIATPTSDSGAAELQFNVPVDGDYVVWCRVKTPSSRQNSFFVTLDRDSITTDIYDASGDVFGDLWHWTPLKGRSHGTPWVLHLAAGAHSLIFEGRESNTGLDSILITGDVGFDAAAAADSRITSMTAYGGSLFELEWPAFPGLSYQVYYKTDLGSATWTPLPGTVTATTTRASFLDTTATGPRRFYRIQVLP